MRPPFERDGSAPRVRPADLRSRPANELLPLVYDHLRQLATTELQRCGPGQTLQATALVHEAWLRVVGDEDPGWECRAHFFGAAARAMRNILVEAARRKSRLKHGGDRRRVEAHDPAAAGPELPAEDYLALDDALQELEQTNAAQARVVMLRFFTGLSMATIAELLGVPEKRVERDWRFARSWLQRRVEGRT